MITSRFIGIDLSLFFSFTFMWHPSPLPTRAKWLILDIFFYFWLKRSEILGIIAEQRDYRSWFRVDKPFFSWYFFQTNLFRLRSSKVRLNFLFGYFSSCFDVFHRKRVSFFFSILCTTFSVNKISFPRLR